jgi:hypothetical protein
LPTYTYCPLLRRYLLVISFPVYASHLTPISDPHNFHKFLLLWKFLSCSLFPVLTLPTLFAQWFSRIPHRLDISTTPYGFLPCHYPLLKFACSRGGIMFAYLFRYGSEIPIFSFCCFCRYSLQNWSKALGIGVGDKGV